MLFAIEQFKTLTQESAFSIIADLVGGNKLLSTHLGLVLYTGIFITDLSLITY